MSHAVWVAAWWAFMGSVCVGAIHAVISHDGSKKSGTHHFGDCTDEMFEAMREVDAMGLSGERLLQAGLPLRSAGMCSECWGPISYSATICWPCGKKYRRIQSVRDL